MRPDVVTLAKGLGGGLPIGACVALDGAAHALRKGDHGTTFGGNPVSCAAALAVLDTIVAQDLLAHVRAVGAALAAGLRGVEGVREVRGSGLWLGVVLDPGHDAPAVVAAAQQAGFLLNAPGPDVLRLAPPLVLTRAEADAFVAALPSILAAAGKVRA